MDNIKITVCALLTLVFFPFLSAQEINASANADNPQVKTKLFENQALTFYYGTGSDFSNRQISNELDNQLKYDFPNKTSNTIKAPTFVGYQYHIKKRISIGMVYCVSNVRTPDLQYPDLQNPSEVTEYHYEVNINSFMGSVDYHWYYKNGAKSSLSLHSGLALGVYDVNFKTEITGGNGQNLSPYNFSAGGNGWQLTLIGVKQSFNYKLLRNFGYVANLGLGTNVIGVSVGATYTL